MIDHACCGAGSNNRPATFRSIFHFGGWLAPGAILLLVPKCPLCIVIYVGMFSGITLTISTASGVRFTLIAASLFVLIYLAVRRLLLHRDFMSLDLK
jgi:hypothetical protein